MSLVNDYVIDIQLGKPGLENPCGYALRGDIEELEVPVGGIVQGHFHIVPCHSGVDCQCLYTPGPEILHLVFHQGNERSNDKGNAVLHHCRNLEAY